LWFWIGDHKAYEALIAYVVVSSSICGNMRSVFD
jgi:hypothetical protein